MPKGLLKSAAVPVPFADPEDPAVPARVVTSPVGNYDLPDGIVTGIRNIKVGPIRGDVGRIIEERRCSGPIRRTRKIPAVPARVVTSPVAITIFRMVLLPESAT